MALATGSPRLRQRPVRDHSLGLVKFVLPNAFNSHVHATQAHELFDQPRARVELAMREGPDSQRVTLARPVRVFVVYGTAVATEAGRVLFFEDVYGHDRSLAALLGLAPVT